MSVGELGSASAVAAALLLALAAVLGLETHRTSTPAAVCATAGSAALIVLGLAAVFGPAISLQVGDVLGFVPIDVRYDPLAGTFLLALGSVGVAASIFAIGYHGAARSPLDGLVYPVFLGAMALVVGAANIFAFLLAWELMALSSAALVVGPHTGPRGCARRLHLPRDDASGHRRHRRGVRHPRCGRGDAPDRGLRDHGRGPARSSRGTSCSCCSWWASAPRPAWCPSTSGCRARIRWRPPTCRRSCRA